MKLKLGVKVKDAITGFSGTVTALCQYITGCQQALVQPPIKDGGDFVESRWFDDDRLQVIDPEPLVLKATKDGPDKPGPRK